MAINFSNLGGVPKGGTSSRPLTPSVGDVFYNGDLGQQEIYTVNGWGALNAIPAVVTNVVATNSGTSRAYNNGSASVAFTIPTGIGTGNTYTVTSTPGSYVGTGSSSPITVTGLQSNTGYTFSVTGTNSFGTSASSASSASITATTVPQAPTIGAAVAGNASATVEYTTGATGGSAITTYTATSNPGGFTGTGASPITVSGLTNGTSYTFTVTATNVNGTSASSSASSSVSPSAGSPFYVTLPAANTLYNSSITLPIGTYAISVTPTTSDVYYTLTDTSGIPLANGYTTSGTGSVTVSSIANKCTMFTNAGTNVVFSVGTSPVSKSVTSAGSISATDTITATGNYTPAAAGWHYIIALGGGMGGSSGGTNGGYGGTGGTPAPLRHTYAYLSATPYTVTIGGVGSGGTQNQADGNTGGPTSFHNYLTAPGADRNYGTAYVGNGGNNGSGANAGGAAPNPYSSFKSGTTGGGGGGGGNAGTQSANNGGVGGGSGIGTGGQGGGHTALYNDNSGLTAYNANGYGAGGGGGGGRATGGNGSPGVIYILKGLS